jgi:hypothetical protein
MSSGILLHTSNGGPTDGGQFPVRRSNDLTPKFGRTMLSDLLEDIFAVAELASDQDALL